MRAKINHEKCALFRAGWGVMPRGHSPLAYFHATYNTYRFARNNVCAFLFSGLWLLALWWGIQLHEGAAKSQRIYGCGCWLHVACRSLRARICRNNFALSLSAMMLNDKWRIEPWAIVSGVRLIFIWYYAIKLANCTINKNMKFINLTNILSRFHPLWLTQLVGNCKLHVLPLPVNQLSWSIQKRSEWTNNNHNKQRSRNQIARMRVPSERNLTPDAEPHHGITLRRKRETER